jgi:diadenosine tetraphosphatase ApaH/serine/threonine PP2A family protein phosphatase
VADARREGADAWLLGGDYALFGAWPAETVSRLGELSPARWIRGNGERWTATPAEAPSDDIRAATAACREELGDETVAELGSLPFSQRDGDELRVHASPLSDVESFAPEPEDGEERLLGDAHGARRLVFGHTHLAFRRTGPGGVELVNPGSVGMPFDGDPRAGYALVAPDGEVELRRVGYDHDRSAAAVRERFPGFGETVATRIERAAFAV